MTDIEKIKYIKNIAKQYARSVQDADDIASISMEKVFNGNIKDANAIKSWIYVIVKRTVYNFYRNSKIMVDIEDYSLGTCEIREFRLDFDKMTKRLTPRRKECLRLYCQGYRWIDIAEKLNISKQNARTSAMDGLKTLKRWYAA